VLILFLFYFFISQLSYRADGALPVIHVIFDTASEEDGAQVHQYWISSYY